MKDNFKSLEIEVGQVGKFEKTLKNLLLEQPILKLQVFRKFEYVQNLDWPKKVLYIVELKWVYSTFVTCKVLEENLSQNFISQKMDFLRVFPVEDRRRDRFFSFKVQHVNDYLHKD